MNLRLISLCILLSINWISLSQNGRDISGIVYNAKDSIPLPGVNIIIKGTNAGAVTNLGGRFFYTVKKKPISGQKLVFNYLGFKTITIALESQNYFTIYLQPETDHLDEVIITTSYGTTKLKEEAVASISQINERDLNVNQSFETIDKMIDGLAPGVQIEGNSQLGTSTRINIRGQGTFTPLNGNLLNASAQPLIIVDGVILSEENGFDDNLFDGGGRFSEQFLNPLAKIPPEDIKSISILKDASAVSIYGADGANGVILITTKKAGKTDFSINFSQQAGFSTPINPIIYLNGPQYHSILTDYYINSGESPSNASALAGSNSVNTNWFDLTNETGTFTRSQLNFEGSTGQLGYRANVSYLNNDEVQINNQYENIRGSVSFSYSNEKLEANLRFIPSYVIKNNPNTLFSFPLRPNISPRDENGEFNIIGEGSIGNPLAVLNQNKATSKTIGLLTTLNLKYDVDENWSISTIVGADLTDKEQDNFFSGNNSSGRFSGTFEVDEVTFPNWGRKLIQNRSVESYQFNAVLSYNKQFGDHSIDGILGTEVREESIKAERFFGRGYILQNRDNSLEEANEVVFNSFTSENARTSLFTQLNYDFLKKYFITTSFREDKSSAFGGDINAAYNGAVGLSWILSKEDFFKIDAVYFLKYRISYGSSGNSRIGSFSARGLYNTNVQSIAGGYNFGSATFPSTAPNPDLGWERNIKFNMGIDFNLLSRFKFSVDFYRDKITNIISSTNAVPESGFINVQANTGSMENKGIEFSLSSEIIDKDQFKFNLNFNLSRNRNTVLNIENLSSEFSASQRASALRVGESTSAIWGYQWIGVDPANGQDLYRVDGQIFSGNYVSQNFDSSHWEVIGDRLPEVYGGLQANFQFFNQWSLTARFVYNIGGDILVNRNFESTDQLLPNRNMIVNLLNYWQEPGDIARNSKPSPGQPIVSNSTKYVYDNTHIKFQNFSLNYKIGPKFLEILNISNANIFINADNIGYWYKNGSSEGHNGIAELRFVYPEMRTITAGINLGI
ncbi:TonB-dependent outer membrane receptor/channel protein [Psychroflexus torquis ATCC 700755]|uniref:TonB-dependent outer membrane receptor/channel protein n=1 Tax=Psychroflexus torquis (strain ATCC 700755 / CIP 106069 / ACAM 623) TaxID=313595 RepID=K4IXC2_PSYTT|nr:SusC/RagA family TonB-linked outer membrane protein [Psychroflexus torquis]AFU70105.1 TonB-dependent outer membrane receptor/channel protein [Psychroflexus torquis ATCC 700755]